VTALSVESWPFSSVEYIVENGEEYQSCERKAENNEDERRKASMAMKHRGGDYKLGEEMNGMAKKLWREVIL